MPGSATGLLIDDAERLARAALGCGEGSGDGFGEALAVADYDDDGRLDLAIGIPGANEVCLLRGEEGGLDTSGELLTTSLAGARFGATLAAADLNDDGVTDLVVGAPDATVDGATGAGRVEVLWGANASPFATRALISQVDAGGLSALDEAFGTALAAGDVNGDGKADLVVGAPMDVWAGQVSGGAYLFYGPLDEGLALAPSVSAPRTLHPDGSLFGASLAIADIDGNGYGEVILGEPGAFDGRGAYTILNGSPTGVASGTTFSTEAHNLSSGNEALASAIVAGDIDKDGASDLVFGVPGGAAAYTTSGGVVVYRPGEKFNCELACGGVCGECRFESQVCVAGTCDFDYRLQPESTRGHTIDGLFTGWTEVDPAVTYEWSDIAPVDALYTDAYLDYDGTYFYAMNDWRFNDATPLDEGCYNLFILYTEDGQKHWQVKLFADGPPQVLLNGEPVDPATVGVLTGYTFGKSPNSDFDHTLFELAIPTGPGQFGATFADPGPGTGCDVLYTEPTVFLGQAMVGGGLRLAANTDVPWITGVNGGGLAGSTLSVYGVGFGTDMGTASVGGLGARVLSWGDNLVTLEVPSGSGSAMGGIVLGTAGGLSTNTAVAPSGGAWTVFDTKSAHPITIDGHMTGFGVEGHVEWSDAIAVPTVGEGTGGTEVFADYDGTSLRLFYDWLDDDHVLVDAHLRGWTGGGSGEVGGPYADTGASEVVLWDILVDGGVITVLRNGTQVTDLVAAGIEVAIGEGGSINDPTPHSGLEVRLPAGTGGFGFALVGGADLASPGTLSVPHIIDGVADPVSGLYLSATHDPVIFALNPNDALIGATLTIDGYNLGASGTVMLGSSPLPGTLVSWSPTRVVFALPSAPATHLGGELWLDTAGGDTNRFLLGVSCSTGTDCTSLVCADGLCLAPTCDDGVKNATETGTDCGGSCAPCGTGQGCAGPSDCVSLVCTSQLCVAASCGDGVRNQGESDIDCGGANCPGCQNNQICNTTSDCAAGQCNGGRCAVPTCFDGIKNQNETDIDCGGICAKCANGKNCSITADCSVGSCLGGVCSCTPQCGGKVCGPDGCGGSCGSCIGVQTCQNSGALCDFEYTTVPRSGYAHTVDGQFTGWTVETRPSVYEWYDVPPAEGQYTNAYFDFTGTTLFMLNDWFFNDAASIDPSCYNLFVLYTGGGAERWQVKVYANGTVQVFKNGVLIPSNTTGVASGYGFTESPRVLDRDHTIYELSLPALPGGFGVQLHDPGPTSGCEVLYREPVSFVGSLTSGGGLKFAENPNVPWLPGSNPTAGVVGTVVEVYGVGLGSTPGTINFGGQNAPVLRWSDSGVLVRVPAGATSAGIRATTAQGYQTNLLPFTVVNTTTEPGSVLNPPSGFARTIDGQFTGWTAPSMSGYEWSDVTPVTAQNGLLYVDYDNGFLDLMVDWTTDTNAAFGAACFTEYQVVTNNGQVQWNLKHYGDGTVEARRNDVLVDAAAFGVTAAMGFGSSPLNPTGHARYEVRLPAGAGTYQVKVLAPGAGDPGALTCAANLVTERANFQGALDTNGGAYTTPSIAGTLYSALPAKVATNTALTLRGYDLGATGGTVNFTTATGTVNATATFWSATEVRVNVPSTMQTGLVKLNLSSGKVTNGILITRVCFTGADCSSGVCQNEQCQLPTCSDGVKNGGETGIDCGGTTCGKCGTGQGCTSATDCLSGKCTSNLCVAPTCSDVLKNGNETDVDCGGGTCGGCAYTKVCLVNGDCASGNCVSGACRPTASATLTSFPNPVGSFQKPVSIIVRVADTGGTAITQARVSVPPGWLMPAVGVGGVTARLSNGTSVTPTVGTVGAGEQGGTWYTVTGLNLQAAGAVQWVEFAFDNAQAQENTGQVLWFTEVQEGLGFGRVTPTPIATVSGAVSDGEGAGSATTNGPVTAGATGVIVTIELLNDLYDYVTTSAAQIFAAWTRVGSAAWSLVNNATHGQVLQTPDNTALPAYFLSNDLMYDGTITLKIGALESGGDDDFIGLVFRWQNEGNYYLLDWKQAAQTNGSWNGRVGLVLRRIRNYDFDGNGTINDALSTVGALWHTAATRNDILGYWDIGWGDQTMYNLKVVLDGPVIQVYVNDVLRMTATDYAFAGGKYGPYTYSQAYTSIKDLAVLRDTITHETVQLEVPAGWPRPTPGASPAGNITATSNGVNATSLLSVGVSGAGPHGGTIVTATPLTLTPGQVLRYVFGPVQAPPNPGTQTWYMWTAGVGGLPTAIEISPTVTIQPAP